MSSSSVELESEGEEEAPCSPEGSSNLSSRSSTTTTTTALAPLPPDSHNPWLQQCHQTTLHKLKQKSDSSNVVGELIVLYSKANKAMDVSTLILMIRCTKASKFFIHN